jgi:hypothetical protein
MGCHSDVNWVWRFLQFTEFGFITNISFIADIRQFCGAYSIEPFTGLAELQFNTTMEFHWNLYRH